MERELKIAKVEAIVEELECTLPMELQQLLDLGKIERDLTVLMDAEREIDLPLGGGQGDLVGGSSVSRSEILDERGALRAVGVIEGPDARLNETDVAPMLGWLQRDGRVRWVKMLSAAVSVGHVQEGALCLSGASEAGFASVTARFGGAGQDAGDGPFPEIDSECSSGVKFKARVGRQSD